MPWTSKTPCAARSQSANTGFYQENTIVSNESLDILKLLDNAFNNLAKNPATLFPKVKAAVERRRRQPGYVCLLLLGPLSLEIASGLLVHRRTQPRWRS